MIRLLLLLALIFTASGKYEGWAQSTYIPLHNPAYHTVDRIDIKLGELNEDLFTKRKTLYPFLYRFVCRMAG